MPEEIINRVAQSKLVVINLEDYYLEGKRVVVDIKDWLFKGLTLREKEFRSHIKNHDWSQYKNTYVALRCSTNAIIPAWAYMLISLHLEPYAKKIIIGSLDDLETSLYQDIINTLPVASYKDKSLIIKGCANKPIPENAYLFLAKRLKPIAKSIMYGEACSAVPLYKKKNKV